MPRFNNTLRSTRPRIGATAALVALLAATAAGCDDGGAAASDTRDVAASRPWTTGAAGPGGGRPPRGRLARRPARGAPADPRRRRRPDRQLIAGIDVVDAEYRDDVLKMIEGQRMLSQAIVDATDATAMRAAIDEVMSQTFVVADGTYEWVGTTCGLDRVRERGPRSLERCAARPSGVPRRHQRHRRPEPDRVRHRRTRVPRRSARRRTARRDDARAPARPTAPPAR